jgi:ABC-type multidrug transport system ATPase subunit
VLASSTPDALWSAPSLRVLRPAAVDCADLVQGRLLDRCTFSIAAGTRLLVVGEPDESAAVLVRVLAGLTRPRRGRVSIAGLDGPAALRAGRVAHLGPDPGMPGWMTPREALGLAADLAGMTGQAAARAIERVVAHTHIPGDALDQPIRRAGPAVAQRAGLAAAILGDPEVLLLDEPLRALDAAERASLLRLPGRRRTVILASRHPASEAGIATHVALLRGGRVAVLARVDELATHGLPLSLRGICALADRGASDARPATARPVTAPR